MRDQLRAKKPPAGKLPGAFGFKDTTGRWPTKINPTRFVLSFEAYQIDRRTHFLAVVRGLCIS